MSQRFVSMSLKWAPEYYLKMGAAQTKETGAAFYTIIKPKSPFSINEGHANEQSIVVLSSKPLK